MPAKKTVEVRVKQMEDAPIQAEVLADAIVSISRAAETLSRSGLNRRAIVVLLRDMLPQVNKLEIGLVLDALPQLEVTFAREKRARRK